MRQNGKIDIQCTCTWGNVINPYPKDSIYYKSAYIVGEAVEFLSRYTDDCGRLNYD